MSNANENRVFPQMMDWLYAIVTLASYAEAAILFHVFLLDLNRLDSKKIWKIKPVTSMTPNQRQRIRPNPHLNTRCWIYFFLRCLELREERESGNVLEQLRKSRLNRKPQLSSRLHLPCCLSRPRISDGNCHDQATTRRRRMMENWPGLLLSMMTEINWRLITPSHGNGNMRHTGSCGKLISLLSTRILERSEVSWGSCSQNWKERPSWISTPQIQSITDDWI